MFRREIDLVIFEPRYTFPKLWQILVPNAFIWTPFCPDMVQAIFKAGTYQVAYQTVGHLISTRARGLGAQAIFEERVAMHA